MMKRLLVWAWRHAIPGVHPRIEEFLTWADGDMAPADQAEFEAHFAGCRQCGDDARRLRDARIHLTAPGARGDETRILQEGLQDLEARMRVWSAMRGLLPDNPRHHLARSAINLRSARAVKLYFGQEAANRVTRAIQQGPHELHLLPAIKPLFNAFLGRKAADSVARHIARTV